MYIFLVAELWVYEYIPTKYADGELWAYEYTPTKEDAYWQLPIGDIVGVDPHQFPQVKWTDPQPTKIVRRQPQ